MSESYQFLTTCYLVDINHESISSKKKNEREYGLYIQCICISEVKKLSDNLLVLLSRQQRCGTPI